MKISNYCAYASKSSSVESGKRVIHMRCVCISNYLFYERSRMFETENNWRAWRIKFTSDDFEEISWRIFSAVSFFGTIFSSSIGNKCGGFEPSTDAFSTDKFSISADFVTVVSSSGVDSVVPLVSAFTSSEIAAADKKAANRKNTLSACWAYRVDKRWKMETVTWGCPQLGSCERK